MNRPRSLRCLSQFFLWNIRIPTLRVVRTYLHLMWMSAYIVCFGVVTCLVTSPIFEEIRRFGLNFHNCYRSQNVQFYLLQLSLEVKCLVESYSDESGSCSHFEIVTCGSIHQFLQVNLSGKFTKCWGRPGAFLMDDPYAHGRSTYQGCQFLSF